MHYNATDGIADKNSSPYISEMKRITREPWNHLTRTKAASNGARHLKPAIVLDADDTMLWTYDMEDADMQFVLTPWSRTGTGCSRSGSRPPRAWSISPTSRAGSASRCSA